MRGDLEAAATHLAAAEKVARREELPWELARTKEAQARLTLARAGPGKEARARELFEESLGLLRRLGCLGDVQRVEHHLAHIYAKTGADNRAAAAALAVRHGLA